MAVYQVYAQQDEEIIEEIIRVFGSEADRAIAVARCESRFRTGVISRTSDVGVFQINLAAHGGRIAGDRAADISWLQDPKNNISFAKTLYDESLEKRGDGFLPWVCYTKNLL